MMKNTGMRKKGADDPREEFITADLEEQPIT